MRRKEFTLRKTKNCDTWVVSMTDEVCEIFVELWRERRLDTNHVFLYKRSLEEPDDRVCRRLPRSWN